MFHPNEDIRRRAEEAISLRVRYGADEPTIKSLIDALQDPDEVVCRGAAYILGEIREIRAVEALIATLYDLNSYVRECAAIALGKIGDPGAVEPLIAALRDPDGGVRRYAAEALGKIGDTRALPELERVAQEDTGKTPWGESVAEAAREAIACIRERMVQTDPQGDEP
jgi:HEAT repeat protein